MASPLQGKNVLITREKHQAQEFAQKVSQAGGLPVQVPLMTISCHNDQNTLSHVQNLKQYKWIFFTSANGVHCFFQPLEKSNMDQSFLSETKFAVVGRKTAHALEKHGYKADFMPSTYSADIMTKEFFNVHAVMEEPVLFVRGNWSRNILPDWFEKNRIQFQEMEVYKTGYHFAAKDSLNAVLAQNDLDIITFTSPSSVEAFMKMNQTPISSDMPIACIGTTTRKQAYDAGFKNLIVPDEFTIEGMIVRIEEYFKEKG